MDLVLVTTSFYNDSPRRVAADTMAKREAKLYADAQAAAQIVADHHAALARQS